MIHEVSSNSKFLQFYICQTSKEHSVFSGNDQVLTTHPNPQKKTKTKPLVPLAYYAFAFQTITMIKAH